MADMVSRGVDRYRDRTRVSVRRGNVAQDGFDKLSEVNLKSSIEITFIDQWGEPEWVIFSSCPLFVFPDFIWVARYCNDACFASIFVINFSSESDSDMYRISKELVSMVEVYSRSFSRRFVRRYSTLTGGSG